MKLKLSILFFSLIIFINSQTDSIYYFHLDDEKFSVGSIYQLNFNDYKLGDNELRKNNYEELNEIAEFLINNQGITLKVKNHLEVWSEEYSTRLSDLRAESIGKYLISKGVNPNQVKSKGIYDKEPYKIRKEDVIKYPYLEEGKYYTWEYGESLNNEKWRISSGDLNNRNVIEIIEIKPYTIIK